MRKLFLLFAMIISLAVSTQAQTNQVATLSHGGTITTYYGESALTQAHEAAVDGDVITLSPGLFTSVSLSKDITIRGAGMEFENNPTILNGDFNIQNNSVWNGDHNLTLEGLYVEGTLSNSQKINNAVFNKISVKNFTLTGASSLVCMDCIFDALYLDATSAAPVEPSFINCIITAEKISPTSAYFRNCVIKTYGSVCPSNSTFTNCIFLAGYLSMSNLESSCTATYCYCHGGDNFFLLLYPSSDTNHEIYYGEVIFKEGTTYELIDDLAATWLGDDGTQVGIYGGAMPFNPILTIPRITKFNVAPYTTEDGKLSVEIEIKSN